MGKFLSLGAMYFKSFKYNLLMSISIILHIFIYGFIYIKCFYPMNIYRILYEWIIDKGKNKDFSNHRVFDPFFSYFGVIILTYFFVKDKKEINKENEKDSITEDNDLNKIYSLDLIEYNNRDYLKEWKGFIYYTLILILWILEENLLNIYVDIFQDLDFWFFELIFVSLIHSKLFMIKIFSHQKLGVAISIIIGSLLKIYSISLSLISDNTDIFYVKYKPLISFAFIYLILITSRSYVNTQIKAFLDIKYISQRILLLSYGIAGTIISFIIGIFINFITCSSDLENFVCKKTYNGKLYYDEIHDYYESGKNMLVRIIVIIIDIFPYFLYIYFYTLIIKYYTPIHVIFSFPIQFFLEKAFLLIFSVLFFREDLFQGDNHIKKFLLDITGDIFAIFGFLIYLEMIELNFCNLDLNLRKNIIKRGEKDYKDSIIPFIKYEQDGLNDTNIFDDEMN